MANGAISGRTAWREAYTSYSAGAALLHWTIAALILLNIAGGLVMTSGLLPQSVGFPAYQFHKTIGLFVLALTVARILWRVLNPPPAHAPTLTRAERVGADIVHYAFYALMLAVPLLGWLLVSVSAAEVPTYLFMLQALQWPDLPIRETISNGSRETLEAFAAFSHKWLALSFLGLLVVHIAGALKHSFVDRLPSFSRMGLGGGLVPRRARTGAIPAAIIGFVAVLGLGLLIGRAGTVGEADTAASTQSAASSQQAAPASEGAWIVDPSASRLGFEAEFSGSPVTGTIGDWSADIVFAPDALGESSASIVFRTASASIDNAFVAPQLQGADGFASADFPEARLTLDAFRPGEGPNAFVGTGELSIKDATHPVEIPFIFETEGENGPAHVTGSARIDRTLYGMGMSNDPAGTYLSKEILVRFELEASRPGS